MSQFSYDVDVETGDITFDGVLSLKDIGDWDSEASEFLNVFMKIQGKNKVSAQIGALSLLFEAIENQEGTEVKYSTLDPEGVETVQSVLINIDDNDNLSEDSNS